MSQLKQLSDQLNLPMIYVSHSAREIAFLCENLLLMEHGQFVDFGPAESLLKQRGLLGQQGQVTQRDQHTRQVTIQLSEQDFANLSPENDVYLVNKQK